MDVFCLYYQVSLHSNSGEQLVTVSTAMKIIQIEDLCVCVCVCVKIIMSYLELFKEKAKNSIPFGWSLLYESIFLT